MEKGERTFWWLLAIGGAAVLAGGCASAPIANKGAGSDGGNAPVARIAGRAGTMCEAGERYEAVRVGKRWKTLCYRGVDLEEARAQVAADLSLPNSEGKAGGCMTCPTTRELLEVEAYILLRDLNWHRGWYHGDGRW